MIGLIDCGLGLCIGVAIWRETYIKNVNKKNLTILEFESIETKYCRLYYRRTPLYYKPKDSIYSAKELKYYDNYYEAKKHYDYILEGKFKVKRKGKLIPVVDKTDLKKYYYK